MNILKVLPHVIEAYINQQLNKYKLSIKIKKAFMIATAQRVGKYI